MRYSGYILLILVLLIFSCKEPEARRPKKHSVNNFHKEVIAQYKKMNAIENKRISAFILKDSLYDYKTSANGFWYAYIIKDTINSKVAKSNDIVTLAYDIKTLNNQSLYPTQQATYKVDKQEFVPGLREGIKLMKEGEKMIFIIPSYRAYGVTGDGDKIKMNQPIKSTIKLIKITKENEEK